MNASGWRCCESCGKQIHCGCIVSFHMFVLLDAGGIECLTCAKKSYILTPNPAWPPPLHFLPSQHEKMKDLSVKSWSAIAGSGPVPWRQAANLFNGSEVQANLQLRMPFEIDEPGSMDRYGVCERLSTASPETKQERSYERSVNGKWRLGLSETLQNGNMGLNVKEMQYPFSNNFKPIFAKNDSSSSNYNLGSGSSSRMESNDVPVSAIISQSPAISIPVGKQVCSQSGIESSFEAQIRNGKSRGDGRSRNHLLPRYRPQITDEELQQISSNSKSVITPLFEKMLSASDAGRIGRLVLPKKCAEAYFPQIDHPEGMTLNVQDVKGKEWLFQFRFWPNNNSRMYVLEGITPCIQSMQLQAGDVVTFSRLEPEGKLVMGGRKAYQGDEITVVGSEASTPEKILEDKPVVHSKRKNSNFGAKSKRLRIENEDTIELKITWKEAQGLMRAPAKVVPSSVYVEGCEFEEFEGAEPVIGRPTILGIDDSGEKIQWVQCEYCFKWRKVPEDAVLPSRWTCSDNVWDRDRSLCSSVEELTKEQLEQMLPDMHKEKEESTETDIDMLVGLEGLDTLANLALQGEGEGLVENRTKHPRHKPGCTCIVCLQPPSGKGTKHKESCDCVVCCSLKRRFRTLMERRGRKQLEKEAESHEKMHNLDTCPETGTSSVNQEEVRKLGYVEESNGALKGQIDLNIQPEREEDLSPRADSGSTKCSGLKQLNSEVIGSILGKQEGGVN